MNNEAFHIDLDRFIIAITASKVKGSMTNYLGTALNKLVAFRLRTMSNLGEDFKGDVVLNAVLKINRIIDGVKDFSTKDKDQLQVLKYFKGLVNFATMEEIKKLKPDMTVPLDTSMARFTTIESDAEVLFTYKYETKINGSFMDLYDMV